jgi:hypothetical protein
MCFQFGTQRARNNSENRSRHVGRGVFLCPVQHHQLVTEQGVLSEPFPAAALEASQNAGDEMGLHGLCDATEEFVRGGGQTST